MKLTTLFVLGAAALMPALATPALAQAAADASPTTAPMPATNAATSSNTASNGQMAMNGNSMSTSGGADTSALSSVPDTQKKYKRTNRTADFSTEAETTKQLNQQVASAGGLPKTQ